LVASSLQTPQRPDFVLGLAAGPSHDRHMKKSDVTCPDCSAGYRRLELETRSGSAGQYRCLICDRVLEVFDGSREIAYRLTVQPSDLRPAQADRKLLQ
jgi:DNA-directed RNA polymerase subunit RPC12/RpoP